MDLSEISLALRPQHIKIGLSLLNQAIKDSTGRDKRRGMATYSAELPVLNTYQAVVLAFSDFLTVAIHTILFERKIYPPESFITARKFNCPVKQSRHPGVCQWVKDAVAAVEAEMLKVRRARMLEAAGLGIFVYSSSQSCVAPYPCRLFLVFSHILTFLKVTWPFVYQKGPFKALEQSSS